MPESVPTHTWKDSSFIKDIRLLHVNEATGETLVDMYASSSVFDSFASGDGSEEEEEAAGPHETNTIATN